ncbi:protein kinase superfamily protein, partial [Striga asiatica]
QTLARRFTSSSAASLPLRHEGSSRRCSEWSFDLLLVPPTMALLQSIGVHGGVCRGLWGGEDGPSLQFLSAAPVVAGSEACDRAFPWMCVTDESDGGGGRFLWWYRQPRSVWCGSVLVGKSLGASQGWCLWTGSLFGLPSCLKLGLGQ